MSVKWRIKFQSELFRETFRGCCRGPGTVAVPRFSSLLLGMVKAASPARGHLPPEPGGTLSPPLCAPSLSSRGPGLGLALTYLGLLGLLQPLGTVRSTGTVHDEGTGDALEFSEVDHQEAVWMEEKVCFKGQTFGSPSLLLPIAKRKGEGKVPRRRDIRGSRSGRHTSFSSIKGGRITLALSPLRWGLVTRSMSEKRKRYTSSWGHA